jgi:hypothetical protein
VLSRPQPASVAATRNASTYFARPGHAVAPSRTACGWGPRFDYKPIVLRIVTPYAHDIRHRSARLQSS